MKRTITIGLVGAGMFGGDVHLRTFSQLQQNGLLPWLGRLGLDDKARALGDIDVRFVALATHTEKTGKAKLAEYAPAGLNFKTYHGEEPWTALLDDFPDLDVLAVATPDHLHAAPILAALERG
ncbi:MAG: gfo/Idh/MocA family oxidoreductase, partial [Candidatus Hydrogenedentes bacterium]|nr:gfo/Idh/MocA family oxidoreductase [Candidatus Hydrogenedentota bacterium]